MIGLVATLQIHPGKSAEFEALFGDLAPKVRANEPGNQLYQLCKSRSHADIYKVLEIYNDEAALKAHSQSPHFQAAGSALRALLAAAPEIEYLDAVE